MAPANQTKERSVHELFARGIPEQKFNVNRVCFPKEKHQNSQKWAKFMNLSLWPFLWFGLPGRLLIQRFLERDFLPCTTKALLRRTQEGCGGLGGENPGAFPKAGPIFQQPSFLVGKCSIFGRDSISSCRNIGEEFSAASKFAGKSFQQGIPDKPQPSRVF